MIYRYIEEKHNSFPAETRGSGLVPNEKADFENRKTNRYETVMAAAALPGCIRENRYSVAGCV